jgi:hypothetical protein
MDSNDGKKPDAATANAVHASPEAKPDPIMEKGRERFEKLQRMVIKSLGQMSEGQYEIFLMELGKGPEMLCKLAAAVRGPVRYGR